MHNFVEDRSYSVVVIKEEQRFWKRILIVDDDADLTMTFRAVIDDHIPAGASSENEEAIWNALICQYMCKDNKDNFCKIEFLQTIINGKIQMPHAYELNEIKKAIDDDKHYYNTLISNVESAGLYNLAKELVHHPSKYADIITTMRERSALHSTLTN